MRPLAKMMARAMLLSVLMIGACVDDDGLPPAGELQEGLNLLKVDSATGHIDGAMVKNGRAVYFQTRRGPMTPQFYRDYLPNAPLYEIDVRYVDEEGMVFLIQKGGDTFVDPTWTFEPGEGSRPKAMDERELDVEIAEAAVAELQKMEIDPALMHEHTALTKVGLSFTKEHREEMRTLQADLVKKVEAGEARMGAYAFRSEIHRENIWYTLGLGEHSAVKFFSTYYSWVGCTNNHGDSACSMGSSCGNRWTWHYDGNIVPPMQSCLTGYDWNDGGGSHNCHDDTRLQQHNARYGTCFNNDLYGGICWGAGSWSAPGCYWP